MGVSTDGILAFGYSFDEGFEFPWGDSEIDDWWESVRGFKPTVAIYDEKGNYLNGVKPSAEVTAAYYAERKAWNDANPLPVEVRLHCSYDYPMVILSVPGLIYIASRGTPEAIDPAALVVTDSQRQALDAFCKEFDIALPGDPKWWLASLWG